MKLIKNIITITILILISSRATAQATTYDTCNSLQQYQGEWRYINGQDTIRIYLRAHRSINQHFNYVTDALWGWHEYKSGNTIIESNYQYRFINLPYDIDTLSIYLSSIQLGPSRDCNIIKLTGDIWDYHQNNEFHLVTATLSNNNTVMTWKQERGECFGVFTGRPGMTLPKNFVLIKQ